MAKTLEPLPALTQRQDEVLLVIADWYARWRQSPSGKELRQELGLRPSSGLTGYIRPLVEAGYLKEPQRYSRRPYQLTPQAIEALPRLLAERDEEKPELKAFVQQFLSAADPQDQ